MSAFACWMVARALLASAATSTMPAPSSSCACWISSYLWGHMGMSWSSTALQHFEGTGGSLGPGPENGGNGLKHPRHGAGALCFANTPIHCQPSPGLQLALCLPCCSPLQQALQELVAGFGHI